MLEALILVANNRLEEAAALAVEVGVSKTVAVVFMAVAAVGRFFLAPLVAGVTAQSVSSGPELHAPSHLLAQGIYK